MESIEWPPASGTPAVSHTDSPPCRIARIVSTGSLLIGMPTIASAMIGVPPIAYTSDSALLAAMRPKSNGSSTIGMKKIGGRDTRLPVVQAINRRVIAGFGADQQVGIRQLFLCFAQNLLQQRRGDFAAAAAAVRQLGQLYFSHE